MHFLFLGVIKNFLGMLDLRRNQLYSTSLLLLTIFLMEASDACVNGSSAVGDCLHTYLERDFPSIEAIVFPKKRGRLDNVLLLDGPELEDQCRRVEEVVECLEEIEPTCRYYHEFFPFRHLVASLRKSINWVCTPEYLRSRFRTLLNSFDCLETARRKASEKGQPCFQPHIPANIWQRIVRLQSDTKICTELTAHLSCTRHFMDCPDEAQNAFKELSTLFLNAWCVSSLPSRSEIVVPHNLLVGLALTVITCFRDVVR